MALVIASPTGPLSCALPESISSPVPSRKSNRSSGLAPPPSPYPQHVDPSPTDSNGTESTDIDEDSQEANSEDATGSPLTSGHTSPITSPNGQDTLTMITTGLPVRSRSNSDDAPQSVIHAPPGFLDYKATATLDTVRAAGQTKERSTNSPITPDAAMGPDDKRISLSSHLNTDGQEAEEDGKTGSRAVSRLEAIPESPALSNSTDNSSRNSLNVPESGSPPQTTTRNMSRAEPDTSALRTALGQSWTLCNTLASLSSNHRVRMFSLSASNNGSQEHAWQSCWRLCQKLYEAQQMPASEEVLPILELCRDFCQALFEVRQRGEEAADSVLRVSFEMNNHLYSTQDRHLPRAFHERTLDFYVTICHRLMKQRTTLAQETDALLRACWSLSQMLFNLRQAGRDASHSDEELLGSAVQACWELCDLFREGWSQVRPDRGTPRPSQPNFPNHVRGSNYSTHPTRPSSSVSSSSYHDAPTLPPETPVTIFDDTASASSPEDISVPNILVLGPTTSNGSMLARSTHHDRWSSNASTLSGYSESNSSKRTSSTATASTGGSHLLRLQYLILKAAVNAGFTRASAQPFPAFVKSLSADAFGPLAWQKQLLVDYKSLVVADASLRGLNNLPSKRLTAKDIATAVDWLSRDEKWTWIRDLYRCVCDFGIEEAATRGSALQLQF